MTATRDDVARSVEGFLETSAQTLQVIGRTEGAWDVLVPSYWKETVACSLVLGERTMRAEAFYMRSPEENHDKVFKLLLQRNERSHLWRFTVNESGDASLVADVPFEAVSEALLDELFGALVTLVDQTYVPYMKTGYASALAEQIRAGGPGVDQPPPWAKQWEGRRPDQPGQ